MRKIIPATILAIAAALSSCTANEKPAAESSVESTVESTVESSVESSAESTVEPSAELLSESSTEAPIVSSTESPTESSAESPTDSQKNSPEKSPPVSPTEPLVLSVQTKEQLHLGDVIETGAKAYKPLNYTDQAGMWFPYMDYTDYMLGKSEAEFREAVAQKYSEARSNGINTIYVHVHPCGDAYYRSELFPKGTYLDGDYDPLAIMLEEGHRLSLSVHAWINPLRAQTAEQMNEVDERFRIKALAQTDVNGRFYLNPSSDEALSLVNDCVTEIVSNYNVDGIHIDDYFYPSTDPAIDAEPFAASGSSDLAAYRLERCSKMVHGIYEAVKRCDDRLLFGISPQGNINMNYSSQYADVRLWGSCIGYCDYIVPQVYFGFLNETCPFAATVAEWQKLVTCRRVSLVIGLAAYKQGAEDRWAGAAGEREWADDDSVLARQIELVNGSENVHGYALYY